MSPAVLPCQPPCPRFASYRPGATAPIVHRQIIVKTDRVMSGLKHRRYKTSRGWRPQRGRRCASVELPHQATERRHRPSGPESSLQASRSPTAQLGCCSRPACRAPPRSGAWPCSLRKCCRPPHNRFRWRARTASGVKLAISSPCRPSATSCTTSTPIARELTGRFCTVY